MLENPYKFKSELEKEGVFISFVGSISSETVESIGSIVKDEMQRNGTDMTKSLNVFSLFIEQIQNIIHYSKERILNIDNKESVFGMISVGFRDDKYFIISGNKIDLNQRERITNKLQPILKMDKSELRTYYREKENYLPMKRVKVQGLV